MLTGKVAIVTGAARGIGLEIAGQLAGAGASVVVADVNHRQAGEAAARLADEGFRAVAQPLDVADPAQVQAAIAHTLELWGRIDILVNNAGILPPTPVERITPEEWDLVLAVNLKGSFLCSQAVIPTMRVQRSGKIISIASSAGQMGGIAAPLHYSASKAGILGLTKTLARVLAADHIQVNAVSPGTTESAMTADWDQATIERLVRADPRRAPGPAGRRRGRGALPGFR